jgi:hypothetical protein
VSVYDQATSTVTLRTRAQVAAFFDGWDLVEPGLVQVPLWRPDGKPPRPKDLGKVWVYGGVAREPMTASARTSAGGEEAGAVVPAGSRVPSGGTRR